MTMWTHDAILSEIRYGRNDAHHVLEALAELSTDKLTRDVIAAHFARFEEEAEGEAEEESPAEFPGEPDEEELSNFLRTGARSGVMPVHPPREAIPSREGVEFPENGHIIVPERPAKMSQKRYRALYDEDTVIVWQRHDGRFFRVSLRGPLSARAFTAKWDPRTFRVYWADEAPADPPWKDAK